MVNNIISRRRIELEFNPFPKNIHLGYKQYSEIKKIHVTFLLAEMSQSFMNLPLRMN